MSDIRTKHFTIFAPAKINMYLHVTGKLQNGYHTLDSLITFADIGDTVKIEPSSEFHFKVKGPFARAFSDEEKDSSPKSKNLVVKAIWELARSAKKTPNFTVTLTKNLPVAAGIGGGSSNAASIIWGLQQWWNLPQDAKYLPAILTSLGADVPVCLHCRPARIRSIGEIIDPIEDLPETPVVLVNPMKTCSTQEVFGHYDSSFRDTLALPDEFEDILDFAAFLKRQKNDLTYPALEVVPEIRNVLNALDAVEGSLLSRLSGSGATCFGIFETEENALRAKEDIMSENPDWWVQSGWLNRPERY